MAELPSSTVPFHAGRRSVALSTDRIRLVGHASEPWGRSAWALARQDVVQGVAAWRLWTRLAWNDIRKRYRRSMIGPFWLTISMAITVSVLGVLYGRLFGLPVREYLPFLTLGFLVWSLMSSLVTDGCTAFTEAERYLRQARLPKTLFVLRAVCRDLMVFGHNLVVLLGLVLLLGVPLRAWSLLALLGILVIAFNGIWIGLLLGLICTRFRDVPQIVGSAMQILFFVTPILYKRDLLGSHAHLVAFNPLAHVVEIIRTPLLGHPPSLLSWLVVLGCTAIGTAIATLVFVRFRPRVTYWL